MIPNPDDTIVAQASALGAGQRGIVRLSGPTTRQVVASVFREFPHPWPAKRAMVHGHLTVPGIHSPIAADLYFSPAPRTYTGQDTAELHLVSSAPLIDALIAALLGAGARAARPGEFTLRAFLNGKKDLPQAEAVNAVIEAGSEDELRQALQQLAGGVMQPLQGLREDLLNLLADIEAGLDFSDEDIQFVDRKELLLRLGKGMAQLTNLRKQLESRSISGRPFRVALVGQPNAGKSSLFNALTGRAAAIVSPVPGTTRDYVTHALQQDGLTIELIDTAGWQQPVSAIESQAQALGGEQSRAADLLLWCVDSGETTAAINPELEGVPMLRVKTKCDLAVPQPGLPATSAKTGAGIAVLMGMLISRARTFSRSALASSLSRCRHHVDACLGHMRAAHSIVLFEDPAELLALELRLTLEQLGEMVGAVYTDDLLDRIFSRFCIGK